MQPLFGRISRNLSGGKLLRDQTLENHVFLCVIFFGFATKMWILENFMKFCRRVAAWGYMYPNRGPRNYDCRNEVFRSIGNSVSTFRKIDSVEVFIFGLILA